MPVDTELGRLLSPNVLSILFAILVVTVGQSVLFRMLSSSDGPDDDANALLPKTATSSIIYIVLAGTILMVFHVLS